MQPSDSNFGSQGGQPGHPVFDNQAPHHFTPRLRPVRGFPAQATGPNGEEMQMLGLSDARQVSDKVVFTQMAAVQLLPLMDGSRTIDSLVDEVGRGLTRGMLEDLIAQLDDAGLLEGPRFEAMLTKMHTEFDGSPNLPPASTAQFGDSLLQSHVQQYLTSQGIVLTSPESPEYAEQMNAEGQKYLATLGEDERQAIIVRDFGAVFDQFISQALKDVDDPAFATLPKVVVAPHLDYQRGWVNYAAVYGRLRVVDRPDRVILLGTNHFGDATGVAACDKGYESPLGLCEIDTAVEHGLRDRLGDQVFANRFDHEREHSIELHIPWIQHIFGKDEGGNYPKVFAALVHDPAQNNGESYDGNGVSLEPFCTAMRAVLAGLPGKTLIISSADLSHAGPAFGDQITMAGDEEPAANERKRIIDHDLETLKIIAGSNTEDASGAKIDKKKSVHDKASSLISSMAWQQNPTRWCSTGNICAAMLIAEPERIDLLNYAAAIDPQGTTMVSSVAMAMY